MTAAPAPAAVRAARDAWLSAAGAPGINVVEVEWTTEVTPAAAHKRAGVVLSKVTRAQALVGVEYANLAVNNGRETGALLWGEWVEGLYPFVITHKGREYARIYTVDGSLSSVYLVNGRACSWDVFAEYLTPAQRKKGRPQGGVLSIKIENLRVVS